MAGGQERILRRRIKTVQSTKKITRAMELIAASRIVKAQQKVAAAKPYSEQLTNVIQRLASAGAGGDQALLAERTDVSTVGYLAICADRGLCGGYNATVLRATERAIKAAQAEGKNYFLVVVGKRAVAYFRYRGYEVAAEFQGFSDAPSYEDARDVAAAVADPFVKAEVDVVHMVYWEFLSAGSQKLGVKQFLPLEQAPEAAEEEGKVSADYEYEPSPDGIMAAILPRYTESRLYSALLEAAASEHAARQRAMKSATDNADDLITSLTRIMNRARQDAITTEIMEIVGGAEALRQGKKLASDDLLIDQVNKDDFFVGRN